VYPTALSDPMQVEFRDGGRLVWLAQIGGCRLRIVY